jgi:pyruvate/2-oxoglutarate dehydrogenase complex dihydrolipoamide acyltransferase (E2) component
MVKVVPYTKNRDVIYDMLTRAKKFHCSVGGTYEFDVTGLLDRIRAAKHAGKEVSLMACMVKATSLLMERHPRFNHHMFHGLFGKKEIAFDHISCNMVVARKNGAGERVIFPVILKNSHRMSLEEICRTIHHHRTADLESLPQIKEFNKLKKMPRIALRYFSYKTRSDPKFYERYFGTFGLSSMVRRGWGGTAGHSLSNTGSAFLPGTIMERPTVVDGEIRIRKILYMMLLVDHFILDGMDMLDGMKTMKILLERPEELGLD